MYAYVGALQHGTIKHYKNYKTTSASLCSVWDQCSFEEVWNLEAGTVDNWTLMEIQVAYHIYI